MHYCFLTIGTWEGNASYVRLREFGNEIAQRGHDLTYIVDDIAYHRDELTLHPQAKIVFVPARGMRSWFARRKMLRQVDADFVHILNPSPKTFFASFANGQRIVCDWDEWPAKRDLGFLRNRIERFIDRWMRRNAAVAVVASKYLQREFEKLGTRAAYIPYAAYWRPADDGASPHDQPTVVYMGNLYPNYDHDLILHAADLLKQKGKLPRMVLLGGGPDLVRWREWTKEKGLDNVELPGFVGGDELWRNLRHARALLFPIRETVLNLCRCPSKTFGYAQARRPVISNRVGEVAEVLGENARYVADTPQAFADAIEEVMDLPADPPDIDYHVEKHNWTERTDRLLEAIGQARQR